MQHNAAFHSAQLGFWNVLQAEATFWWLFPPRTVCSGAQFSDWCLNRCACKIHPHVPSVVTESPAALEKETCLESGLK